MLTLIKREIQDSIIFFTGALITSVIIVLYLIVTEHFSEPDNIFFDDFPVFIVIMFLIVNVVFGIGLTAMGVSQMYADKNKKISAFLSTLSVTRNQILIARIITGILAILILLLPLIITITTLYQLSFIPVVLFEGIFFEVFTVTFLMCLSCYFVGLLTGWKSGKLFPTMGGLFLACILIPIIIVKGFGTQISLLLILFVIASLIHIRQEFMTTPL